MNATTKKPPKIILYLALAVLYLLHNDFWNWSDTELLFGLPVGLTYHIGYCLVALLLFHLLIRRAWPEHLESSPKDGEE